MAIINITKGQLLALCILTGEKLGYNYGFLQEANNYLIKNSIQPILILEFERTAKKVGQAIATDQKINEALTIQDQLIKEFKLI